MTTGYQRKTHLAGVHCGSADGRLPPPTMPAEHYQHLQSNQRCAACDKRLGALLEALKPA